MEELLRPGDEDAERRQEGVSRFFLLMNSSLPVHFMEYTPDLRRVGD